MHRLIMNISNVCSSICHCFLLLVFLKLLKQPNLCSKGMLVYVHTTSLASVNTIA